MSKFQIVLSGVGGQGLVACADVLGGAATEFSGKYAAQTTLYGSEARGTFTKSDLIISDEPISYPEVEEPQVVVSLAQVAYDRYVSKMPVESVLVYDTDAVVPVDSCTAKQYGFSFTKMARKLGNENGASLIAAGFIVKLTGALGLEAVEKSIQKRFSGRENVIQSNLNAFRMGIALEQ